MKLSELIKNIKPTGIKGDTGIDITGIDIDSRKVSEGYLFIAMRGTQVDGHQFIPKATAQGAVAILCETMPTDPADGVTYITVDSTEQCVGPVATTFFGDPSRRMKLPGIRPTA